MEARYIARATYPAALAPGSRRGQCGDVGDEVHHRRALRPDHRRGVSPKPDHLSAVADVVAAARQRLLALDRDVHPGGRGHDRVQLCLLYTSDAADDLL